MDKVQIVIQKDGNTVSYIKLIREYDSSVSISEIKNSIEKGQYAYEFDLDGREWMYLEQMTQFEWHWKFYQLLLDLESAGAKLDIFVNDRPENMQFLANLLHRIKEIGEDCERYPD